MICKLQLFDRAAPPENSIITISCYGLRASGKPHTPKYEGT